MSGKSSIGMYGLGVMGQALTLNIARKGYSISAYNLTPDLTDEFKPKLRVEPVRLEYDLRAFMESLERPRKIILLIKAGKPVDMVIQSLIPLADPGDLIIDGGNSYYKDTERRMAELREHGILFLGMGVSGGEYGALHGPSLMPGGPRKGYDLVSELLDKIAAQECDGPCTGYIGPGASGHFVKMVHNGIEYGDMQLICEAYYIMAHALGMSDSELREVFAKWNEGELSSYLIEITADIFTRIDPETGKPLVDVILDKAGQKGTGSWTGQVALEYGIPAPTIVEAVFARSISAMKEQRVEASKVITGPSDRYTGDRDAFIEAIRQALYASKICSYAQGFALLREASIEFGWDLDYGRIANMWRGGCIIRAQFLTWIKEAYDETPDLPNLMLAPYFRDAIERSQADWRLAVSTAVTLGIPVPAFSSALAYFDSYRRDRLSANLIQAQRDYFGSHTYERIDKPGVFHTEWTPD